MDWNVLITAVIGFIGGGGLFYLISPKSMARKVNAEADKGVIDNYETMIERYEKFISNQEIRYTQTEEFHNSRYTTLKQQLDDNTTRIKELSNKINTDKPFLCYDMECKVRKRQNFTIKN